MPGDADYHNKEKPRVPTVHNPALQRSDRKRSYVLVGRKRKTAESLHRVLHPTSEPTRSRLKSMSGATVRARGQDHPGDLRTPDKSQLALPEDPPGPRFPTYPPP